jgi:hypothetical protein
MSCPGSVVAFETSSGQVAVGEVTATVVEIATPGPQGIPGPAGSAAYTTPTTVAALPVSPQGYRAFVTDATTTTFGAAPVGGGTNAVPVYFDGVIWRIG